MLTVVQNMGISGHIKGLMSSKKVHLQRTSGVNKEIGTKPNPESVHFPPGCLHYLLLFSK